MLVIPQGRVNILHGIPWTNDYKHVRLFEDNPVAKTEQYNYMLRHVKHTFTDFSYIREQNVIRVPINAEQLYDCNYIMYQNRGFGNKWFYAFITGAPKYVNNESSEISFEIDEFNTWFYDLGGISPCYVEREHVKDDTIGLHTVDEGLGTGNMIIQSVWNRYWKDNALSPATEDKGFIATVQVKPSLLGAFVGDDPVVYEEYQLAPLTYKVDPISNVAGLINEIRLDSITGYEFGKAYMIPKEFESGETTLDNMQTHGIQRPTSFYYNQAVRSTHLPYTPKNNKLLTYPYTKLLVVTSSGNTQEYKWENSGSGIINFRLIMNVMNKPSCSLLPTNYEDENGKSRLKDLPITDFPEIDLGQYSSLNVKNIVNTLASGIGAVTGAVLSNAPVFNPTGAITEGANAITGLLTDKPSSTIATNGDNLMLYARMLGYSFYVMGITGEYAEMIDNYLTRFGYRVNKIKVPELFSRKYWNFVKTKEIEIGAGGYIPADSMKTIQDMFNNGVTFWHTDRVGDFSLNNEIVI